MIDMDDVVEFCSSLMMATGFLLASAGALFLVLLLGVMAWAIATDAPLPDSLRCTCDQSYLPPPVPPSLLGIR